MRKEQEKMHGLLRERRFGAPVPISRLGWCPVCLAYKSASHTPDSWMRVVLRKCHMFIGGHFRVQVRWGE